MNQMTEASKKRMEEGAIDYSKTVAPESIEQWVAGGYRNGYQAGMQDPESSKELLNEAIKYVEDLMYPEAKTRDMGTYNKAIQDAVNRLNKIREARK